MSVLLLSCSQNDDREYIKELRESDNVIRINLDSNIDPNERALRFFEDSLNECKTMRRLLPKGNI